MSGLEPSAGLAVIGRAGRAVLAKERGMSALLIARFDGDVEELTRSYDRAHALIMSRGGRHPSASCAITVQSEMALFTSWGCGIPRSTREAAGQVMSLRKSWPRAGFRLPRVPI